MKSGLIRSIAIFVLLALNISCDQITKNIVRDTIADYEQIPVIENYVTLHKVENEGAFLSAGSTLPKTVRFILLSVLPLAVLGFGLGYLFFKKNVPMLTVLGFAFVIGGGIGNLYDRLVYGSVTDFLHIDFVLFQTGIFNMADVSIMTGVGIVLLGSFLNREKTDTIAPVQ